MVQVPIFAAFFEKINKSLHCFIATLLFCTNQNCGNEARPAPLDEPHEILIKPRNIEAI